VTEEFPDVELEPSGLAEQSRELLAGGAQLALQVAVASVRVERRLIAGGISRVRQQAEYTLGIGDSLGEAVMAGQPMSRLRQADIDLGRAQDEGDPDLILLADHDVKKAFKDVDENHKSILRTQLEHITKVRIGSLAKKLKKGYQLSEDEHLHYKTFLDDTMNGHTFESIGISAHLLEPLERAFPDFSRERAPS
jgi:hypothetical protein